MLYTPTNRRFENVTFRSVPAGVRITRSCAAALRESHQAYAAEYHHHDGGNGNSRTVAAIVMVVFGSVSLVRFSQGCCARAGNADASRNRAERDILEPPV